MFELTYEMVEKTFIEFSKEMDWKGFEVSIKKEAGFFTTLGIIGNNDPFANVGALTDPFNHKVVFYVDAILKELEYGNKGFNKFIFSDKFIAKIVRKLFCKESDPVKLCRMMIHEIVAHENRHCQQYNWLEKNLSKEEISKIIKAEKGVSYGKGAMEKDAIRYQSKEKHIPFEEVFKDFLKTT